LRRLRVLFEEQQMAASADLFDRSGLQLEIL
jgi:hypothetical protein